MTRYIVIAPNMQWIRHWRGEQWREGNLDVKSERNIISITGGHDIRKIQGLGPLKEDKLIWLGPPQGHDILRELSIRGFKI